ncbi:hypothetical protein [Herpetosiphon sp. NSE202]|uniref:hypothetical protein n=1 Tax=Herpetosiphon sp. NSE202 TaxID=3351349 RepID=UPI003638E735
MLRRITAIAALLILTACGGQTTPTTVPTTAGGNQTIATATPAATGGYAYDTSAAVTILELRNEGGFVTPLYNKLLAVPQFRLYGNGELIYQYNNEDGKMFWQQTTLNESQIKQLLSDVLGAEKDFCLDTPLGDPEPMISDVNVTTLTVNLTDGSCSAQAYAAFSEQRSGLNADGQRRFAQFRKALAAVETLMKAETKPYQAQGVTIYLEPAAAEELATAAEWTFKAELREGNVVTDSEAAAILEFAGQPTLVKAGDKAFRVLAVPILP